MSKHKKHKGFKNKIRNFIQKLRKKNPRAYTLYIKVIKCLHLCKKLFVKAFLYILAALVILGLFILPFLSFL